MWDVDLLTVTVHTWKPAVRPQFHCVQQDKFLPVNAVHTQTEFVPHLDCEQHLVVAAQSVQSRPPMYFVSASLMPNAEVNRRLQQTENSGLAIQKHIGNSTRSHQKGLLKVSTARGVTGDI